MIVALTFFLQCLPYLLNIQFALFRQDQNLTPANQTLTTQKYKRKFNN